MVQIITDPLCRVMGRVLTLVTGKVTVPLSELKARLSDLDAELHGHWNASLKLLVDQSQDDSKNLAVYTSYDTQNLNIKTCSETVVVDSNFNETISKLKHFAIRQQVQIDGIKMKIAEFVLKESSHQSLTLSALF